jgi:hypothetical protein
MTVGRWRLWVVNRDPVLERAGVAFTGCYGH